MTSGDRVLAEINHEEPARIPVDMGATFSSGISAIACSNLVKHFSSPDLHVLIYDVVQQLAQPDDHVPDLFGIDIADIIRFGDDLEMSTDPFMDSETCKALFKPRHKIFCDYVKSHSKIHMFPKHIHYYILFIQHAGKSSHFKLK